MNRFTHPFGPGTAIALSTVALAYLVNPLSAQAQKIPGGLTPNQIQQINRNLVPSSAQDFFQQGRDRLEREIQLLAQRTLFSTNPVLKINDNLRLQTLSQPNLRVNSSYPYKLELPPQ